MTINMSMPTPNDNDTLLPSVQDTGVYVLMGEIDNDSVKPVIEWIILENYGKGRKRKELLLMVCSEGGDLAAAFALIDTMNSSLIPIKTVGLGQIASCGLLIFLAGAKGRRVLTPNTSILSHQFAWYADGKAHELFATMKEFELTQQRMVEHYQKTTRQSLEVIREKFLPAHDVWLSAEEALKLNICDHVDYLRK